MFFERYSRPIMKQVWSEENKLNIWRNIESLVAEVQGDLHIIPAQESLDIIRRAKFQSERVKELENVTHHEFNAFLKNMSENIGDAARYLHYGLTSSDVLDTGLAIQIQQATTILLEGIKGVADSIREKAIKFKETLCCGRTHGIHAEPTTFGLKLLGHWSAFRRHYNRIQQSKKDIEVGAISGAIGTYATIDPEVEKRVLSKLGLQIEPVSTQVIPRDRHAIFICTLAVVAGSIENLATEIRHLQRTEIREVEEPFSIGQTGSSAMPHKRNPIKSENLTGLSRLIRTNCQAALENITLWHERDMSHSSVERIVLPQTTILLDFALDRLKKIIDGLIVYPERMKDNLMQSDGIIFSQRILLTLIEKGMDRQIAYNLIQKLSHQSIADNHNFYNLCTHNQSIAQVIDSKELKELFDVEFYIQRIPYLFERALNN